MGFELKLSAHVILGIESSCDDTAAAIVSYEKGNSKILSSVLVNQNTLHEKYGGVVPEIAARAHANSDAVPVLIRSHAQGVSHG